MKKFAALLAILVVLILQVMPVAAEGITVSSENGDEISVFDDVIINENVNGNVIVVLGDVTVNSGVNGQIVAVFGEVYINSEVSKQVVTVFGKTTLGKDAVVHGDVITMGSMNKNEGARILGQDVRIFGESMNLDIGALSYLRLLIVILFTLAVLVVGLLVLSISKDKYTRIAKKIDINIGRKLLLGILSFVSATILLMLLLLTLIAPFLYIILMVLATVPASMFLGRMILKAFSSGNSIYMEFFTGLITITLVKFLLSFIILPESLYLGIGLIGLLNFFIYSMGLGIYMEERYLKEN